MKALGVLALIIGAFVGIGAMSMDVTVSTGFGTVNNIGLMNDRANYLMIAGVLVIAGVLMVIFGGRSGSATVAEPADPFDAMDQRSEIDRKRYAISIGVTREAGIYHYRDQPYSDLDAAIAAAEEARKPKVVELTEEELEARRLREERYARQDRTVYWVFGTIIGLAVLAALFANHL